MLRPYSSGAHDEEVEAFVGSEVEHTPAYRMTTLFIVGRLGIKEVRDYVDLAQERVDALGMTSLRHIFFGANWSFDGEDVLAWSNLIKFFLREGFWCTLDFRPAQVPLVQKTGLCRHARFIPLMGVRIPSAYMLGPNATLKVDDTSFAGTNRGVWCLNLHSILNNQAVLTEWKVYSKDVVLPKPLKD